MICWYFIRSYFYHFCNSVFILSRLKCTSLPHTRLRLYHCSWLEIDVTMVSFGALPILCPLAYRLCFANMLHNASRFRFNCNYFLRDFFKNYFLIFFILPILKPDVVRVNSIWSNNQSFKFRFAINTSDIFDLMCDKNMNTFFLQYLKKLFMTTSSRVVIALISRSVSSGFKP